MLWKYIKFAGNILAKQPFEEFGIPAIGMQDETTLKSLPDFEIIFMTDFF